jgi:23S rRNA pseudouridine1911/1915/1917 synthase
MRLDAFLAARLGVSRKDARRLVARGRVRMSSPAGTNATPAKGTSLAAGARVQLAPGPLPGDERPRPEPDAPLRVLASGTGWIALDKPAGMPVHPLAPDETGTLLGALAARHPTVLEVGERGLQGGVVHRLDVDTSGVVLFALDDATWRRLRDAFAAHRVRKRYRAIVHGHPPAQGHARVWLRVARHRPARVRVERAEAVAPGRGAREARLSWRTLERFGTAPAEGAALVEVDLETGFLHQVRATFAHLGHPLLGDRVYGPEAVAQAARRQMLHAASITLDEIRAASADPDDFVAALIALHGGGAW